MRLGKYFTLAELTRSTTASRLGIENYPASDHLENLKALVANVLDPLREAIGKPIIISSGYRNPEVNRRVGGVTTSQHATGQAADLTVKGMTPAQIIKVAKGRGIPYDQIIDEFGSWVHVSYGPRHRRQVLAAVRDSSGRTIYTNA